MKKEDGFNFIPKKWLGDANVIAMDWDCKGMHLHLMAIAWQQPIKGYLIDDEKLILKVLGNPDKFDWENRIKPQIFQAWKKKTLIDSGVERNYWYQPGIIKTVETSLDKKPVTRSRKKKEDILNEDVDSENQYEGFELKNILKVKSTATILHEKATVTDKSTIWTLGVGLVKQHDESDAKARSFLAGLIKQYGEKHVAQAIAEISLKKINPAEIHSFLVGVLKNKLKEEETGKKHGSNRGKVVL